jgi:hypothetical protein
LVRHERAGLDGSNYGSVTHSLKKVPVTILEDSKDIKYADFVDVTRIRTNKMGYPYSMCQRNGLQF